MAITNFIPQMWAGAVLSAFAASEVVAPLTNRQYEGEARSGNRVNITSITTPTVVDYKAAGRTVTPSALSDTQVAILIDQEKAIAFKVDDVDRVQAAGSFDSVTTDSAKALSEDGETYIIGKLLAEGTNDQEATPVVLDSPVKAYAAILKLRTTLKKAKVPYEGRYLIVNPDFAALMLAEASKLTAADTAGTDSELRNGVLGRLLGFTIVESELLNPAKPSAVAMHRSAVAYVNQIEKVEALRDANSFADVVRMLHVYGAKVIRPTAVRRYVGA